MKKDLRTATIVALVQNAKARLGKIQVQKLVYFSQHAGVPTEYKYEIYHYGPYSFELAHDLGSLDSLGVVNIQSDPSGYGFDISVGKFAAKFTLESKYQKKVDKVLELLGSNSSAELEVKATIHFVHSVVGRKTSSDKTTKTEVVQKVRALKPRFTESFIMSCYSDLQRTHWL